MAETTKKPNTIKSIGKKVANNGNADDYIYVPIGADSDNVDRPDGSTVEESLSEIEIEKVEIIPVESLPTSEIQVYPFIYALVKANESKGIFYEYRDGKWIKYGNGANGIWVGTKEECAKEFDNIETGTIVIIVKKGEESGDTHTHDYVEYVTKAPTYSEPGIKTCKCFLCGESYTEEIPALIDSVKPAGVIRIGNNEYATWKDTVSFDTYYKDNQTVTIEASDNETGIKEIAYHLANTAVSDSNIGTVTWTPYTDPFTIEPNNNFIVYVRITDNSDNVTYICSDGIVMDNIPPVFEGLEDGGTYPTGTVLTVEDGATLTVDGVAVELVNNTYTFTEPKDNIQLSLRDRAGNENVVTISIFKETYDIGTKSMLRYWEYELDNTNNTILLNSLCDNTEEDLIIYANYKIDGVIYKTKLVEYTFEDDIKNHVFEFGHMKTIKFSDNFDFSSMRSMCALFYNCNQLVSIDFGSNFNTCNINDMSYMFNNCSSLVNIDLSDFDTKKVTNMFRMFSGCTSIKELDLTSFDINNVKDMRYMFNYSSSLENIYVSSNKWKINSTCDAQGMFYNCGVSNVTYV